MTSDEALEVLGYLLGHEKAVDSGEMEDIQNRLNSQEQEALKVVLSEFQQLKEKATAKQAYGVYIDEDKVRYECPHCHKYWKYRELRYCGVCGQHIDWSEGKE